MRKSLYLAIAAATAFALPAGAKEKLTYAYLQDPVLESVMWPIRNGKVKSDMLEIEGRGYQIPVLIQGTGTKQWDVVMTAVMSVPRAKAMGLELRVLSTALRYHKSGDGAHVWVKKGSPIKSIKDLKGKIIGTYGLQSTGITLVRLALWKKYGVNVQYEGGDFTWQQLPAPALPGALATGKIDAATLIHSQAYQAAKTGDFVPIARTAEDMWEMFKLRMVSAVNVGYVEKIAAKPALYKEFNRMLHESIQYTLKHIDEVSQAVGKETKNDPAYFKAWFEQYSDFAGVVSDNDIAAMDKVWALSKELGILKGDIPTAKSMIWEGAIRE
ncbi:MAG: ABC transporter substrate-binding protein [Rhodospirillaceae bacterium]|nr:ABC transporter substrate-binding protein [Rhodospirillaceae bacterium]